MATPRNQEDDLQGQPVFLMRPAEDVYSYFMFIGPTDAKRRMRCSAAQQNQWDWDVIMGYILVCMNFFMQGVLLYLIFQEVVVSNIQWQSGIMKLGSNKVGNPLALSSESASGCNDGGSLCFHSAKTGDYSCAPPSLQLTGRWDELDTNGDGVWTRMEVEKEQETLQCKYAVNPLEVFDTLVSMLKERDALIWLHPDVYSGKAIHRSYFTYILSDFIICGYRSVDMCSNLIERGFFDAPLKNRTSPRVGTSIDSALTYCTSLLEPGGACDRNLPSTYKVWRTTSNSQCGEPEYSQFEYTNPGSGQTKTLLSVDYGMRQEYELAQDFMFRLFKAIIIFMWLLLMTTEFKDVYKVLTFCARMPDAADFGDESVIMEQDPADPEHVRYRIQGITKHHRLSLIFVSILRVVLTCVLAVIGVAYLIKTNGYADLIMNGVALVFIAEISAVLYGQVLRTEVKDQTEDIKPIKVRMYGWDWLNDRPALLDCLCVVGIWILVYFIMRWQMTSVVLPVHDALQCACLSAGERCEEAHRYNFEFWNKYWLEDLPGSFLAFARLKASVPAAAASYLSVTSNLASSREQEVLETLTKRVNLLQGVVHLLEAKESHEEAALKRPDHGAPSAESPAGTSRPQHKKNRGQAKAPRKSAFLERPDRARRPDPASRAALESPELVPPRGGAPPHPGEA